MAFQLLPSRLALMCHFWRPVSFIHPWLCPLAVEMHTTRWYVRLVPVVTPGMAVSPGGQDTAGMINAA